MRNYLLVPFQGFNRVKTLNFQHTAEESTGTTITVGPDMTSMLMETLQIYMQHFCSQMSQNDKDFAVYCSERCSKPNKSRNQKSESVEGSLWPWLNVTWIKHQKSLSAANAVNSWIRLSLLFSFYGEPEKTYCAFKIVHHQFNTALFIYHCNIIRFKMVSCKKK